jgi:hypothetical protein
MAEDDNAYLQSGPATAYLSGAVRPMTTPPIVMAAWPKTTPRIPMAAQLTMTPHNAVAA